MFLIVVKHKLTYWIILWAFALVCFSCNQSTQDKKETESLLIEETVKPAADTPVVDIIPQEQPQPKRLTPTTTIDTKDHSPIEILTYARTLIGTPYLFASTDPAKGFDCSGFITYVFNHFNIWVPRSSVEFTNQGKDVELSEAEPGDIILFTGTDSTIRIVGHMGIVENVRNDSLFFIHSSSGKANGVVITPLSRYYIGRFVKVIRVFPDRYFVNVD
jgi:cell wall-associated NlpC family hydrolase